MIFLTVLYLYINTFGDYLELIYSDKSINLDEKVILVDELYEYHESFDSFEKFIYSGLSEPYYSYLSKKHLQSSGKVIELSTLIKNIHPINDITIDFYKDCKKKIFSKKISFQNSKDMIDLDRDFSILFDGCYKIEGIVESGYNYYISEKKFHLKKIDAKGNYFKIVLSKKDILPFTIYKFKKDLIISNQTNLSIDTKKKFPYIFTEYLDNGEYLKYLNYKKGQFEQPRKKLLKKLFKTFPDIHLIAPDYFLEDEFTIDEKLDLLNYISQNSKNMGILLTWERFFKDWEIFEDKVELIKDRFLLNYYHKQQIYPDKNQEIYKKKDINFDDSNIKYLDNPPDKDIIIDKKTIFEFFSNGKYEISVEESIFYKTGDIKYYEINYIDFEERVFSADIYLLYSDGTKVRVYDYLTETPFSSGDIYSDYKVRKYDLSDKIEPNTLLVAKYKVESSDKRDYFDGFISFFESLYSKIAINSYQLEVIYPKNEKIEIFSSVNIKKNRKVVLNKIHEIYKIDSIDEGVDEIFSPSFLQKAPYFVISNIKSWNDLAFWFQKLMHHDYEIPENLKKEIFEKIPKTLKREEIIEKIYKFITKEIRYIGIELGVHSYKPYSPKEILDSMLGDCKDKSILFLSLLTLYGIKGEIVLIRSYDLGKLPATTPSYLYFNHAIVYLFDEDRYFDLSSYSLPFGELPLDVANGSGFHITSMKIKTPLLTESISKKEIVFKILNSEDALNISIKYIYGGFFSDMFRRDLDSITSSKKIEPTIYKYYHHPIELKNYRVIESKSPTFEINFSYLYPKELKFKKFSPLKESDFFLNRVAPNLPEQRYYDYEFPYFFEEIYIYQFDSSFQILSFEDKTIDNEFFKFESKLKDNQITIRFLLKQRNFPFELYQPFREALMSIDNYLKKPIFFQ